MPSYAAGVNSLKATKKKREIRISMLLWPVCVLSVLVWGWINRNEGYLTPERGAGYLLGIIGGSLMLLVLLYSLRKRNRFLRKLFKLPRWFQFHMTLGIAGPGCILFHCNFHFGSMNSSVALVSMMIVVISGLTGRFLYTRIHYGQNREKIKLSKLVGSFQQAKIQLINNCHTLEQKQYLEELFGEIIRCAKDLAISGNVFLSNGERNRTSNLTSDFNSFMGRLELEGNGKYFSVAQASIQEDIVLLLSVLRRLPRLRLFEKMFSVWYVLHIPFYILMIVTAITHVVVVHMY